MLGVTLGGTKNMTFNYLINYLKEIVLMYFVFDKSSVLIFHQSAQIVKTTMVYEK